MCASGSEHNEPDEATERLERQLGPLDVSITTLFELIVEVGDLEERMEAARDRHHHVWDIYHRRCDEYQKKLVSASQELQQLRQICDDLSRRRTQLRAQRDQYKRERDAAMAELERLGGGRATGTGEQSMGGQEEQGSRQLQMDPIVIE